MKQFQIEGDVFNGDMDIVFHDGATVSSKEIEQAYDDHCIDTIRVKDGIIEVSAMPGGPVFRVTWYVNR